MAIELDSNEEIRKQEMYKLVDFHCKFIKKDMDSAKSQFIKLCKSCTEAGYSANEVWQRIKENLKNYIPERTLYYWADKVLPVEAKDQKQRNRRLGFKQKNAVASLQPEEHKEIGTDQPRIDTTSIDSQPQEQELEDQEEADQQSQQPEQDMDQYNETTLRNIIIPQLQNRIKELERRPMGHDALYNQIDQLKKENLSLENENTELRESLKELIYSRQPTLTPQSQPLRVKESKDWLLQK